jgi:methylenetetrahydrofolate dehydrogenase (NADP+) / methenyltetrahydrofolate cyclohydrolase
MIIDGRALARQLNEQTAERIKDLTFKPLLCDVVVGDDPASLSYVGIKQRTAEKYGFRFRLEHLPEGSTAQEVKDAIANVQSEPDLRGLIVQLPLPADLPSDEILSSISQEVDVDLINPISSGVFYQGNSKLVPPTAGAILHILDSLNIDLKPLSYVVVGQGELVGKPTAYLLEQRGYEVQAVTKQTPDRESIISSADVIISGAGQPGIITGELVKPGAIVIDAGTSESGGAITGDVDQESVISKAGFLTPVPGGVGPVTVAKLLENVAIVAERI